MAQKINPTALRLTVIHNWNTIGLTKYIESDILIRNLIRGYLIKYGYLSSEIIIKKTSKIINLTLLVYPLKPIKEITYCVEFLKLILAKLKPNYLITFHIREITSLTKNAKILSEWIKLSIFNKPKSYSTILKSLFKSNKKNNIIDYSFTKNSFKK